MPQIRWTTREWQQIAERLAANGVVPSEHGWRGHLLDAMRGVLPFDRWRDAANLNDAKRRLAPLIKEAGRKTEGRAPTPAPKPTLSSFTIEQLLAEVVQRAVTDVMGKVREQLAVLTTENTFIPGRPPKDHNPFGLELAPHVPRNPRVRVLVVGPRNGQQKELITAYKEWLDLRFVASEDSPVWIASHPDSDHVVIWTNFISHAHQEQAKKLGGQLHYVTGGMSALHDKLRELS